MYVVYHKESKAYNPVTIINTVGNKTNKNINCHMFFYFCLYALILIFLRVPFQLFKKPDGIFKHAFFSYQVENRLYKAFIFLGKT